MSNVKDIRMKLTPEQIKDILGRFGIIPFDENETEIIYPTVCHNLTGGSPKLYYYKNEKIFKCYTQCHTMFDIFELIIKIKKLRGETIGLSQAIEFTGQENTRVDDPQIYKDLEYLNKMAAKSYLESNNETNINILNKDILKDFPYDEVGLKSWIDEGISKYAILKFNIGFEQFLNAITIPNFDYDGNLIGIRGRFLNPNSKAKYMPIIYKQKILNFPTGKFLYGYYENKETIKNRRIAIIFEGEKSVLKMESIYPNSNIALATTGKKLTLDHQNALLKLNLSELVLAYDKDYNTESELKEKLIEYDKVINFLKPYFNVSIIIDYENKLNYKNSPIDQGKEVFEHLMKNRLKR